MCGGSGTRLGDGEKPLVSIGGRPMVERVRDALSASDVEAVYAVTSPEAPDTAAQVDLPRIETPGEGYVADLDRALADDRVERPVLTVAADLPLLTGQLVDRVLATHAGSSLSVAVPTGRVRALGFSVDTTLEYRSLSVRPAGINVVGGIGEATWVTREARLAANVNRPGDVAAAEWWLAGGKPSSC